MLFIWYLFTQVNIGINLYPLNSNKAQVLFIDMSSLLAFIFSYLLMLTYLYFNGFYNSAIGSYHSQSTLLRSLMGSFLYATSYVIIITYLDVSSAFGEKKYLSIGLLLFFSAYAILNIIRDIAGYLLYLNTNKIISKNVLIYGAGSAGKQLLEALKVDASINVIGFYDDDIKKEGTEIAGFTVYTKNKLQVLKESYDDLLVYLAIPSAKAITRNKIIAKLEDYKISVRTVPGLMELIRDDKKLSKIQDLSIEDILPRDASSNVDFDFSNKNILITGAGGSIGSELCRQLLFSNAKSLVLYELSEFSLYSIKEEVDILRSKYANKTQTKIYDVLGDVKNKDRLKQILKKYNIHNIYHAAAYKHVPIVEKIDNKFEAVRNNVFETLSVLQAAIDTNVKKVVVISTDKAVRPTNIMGASKRVAEQIAQAINHNQEKTKISMVRFGNVINSSGSVIPLFKNQIQSGGPVTITHKDVTRYFMTIPEASNLVVQAGEYSNGGEVFLLNMGKEVRIYDLAKKLIHLSGRNISDSSNNDGIEIKEIGLRPGEKLYEELLINGGIQKTANPRIFMSKEEFIKFNDLSLWLEKINDSIDRRDENLLNEIFSNIVSGYRSQSL